jgi:hypothetical protein
MTDFKKLVLGNAGKKNVSNPLKGKKGKGRTKKGKWSDKEEEGMPRKKKPSEGNLYVDVSNWF